MHSARAVYPLAADTSPDIERLQVEAWRAMSPAEKAAAVTGLTQAALDMAMAGLRQRFPEDDSSALSLRLAVLMLGPRLARLVHPDLAPGLSDGR